MTSRTPAFGVAVAGYGPTADDLAKLALARAGARLAVRRSNAEHQSAITGAFRAELSATVRAVSPFLLSLCHHEGLSLNGLVRGIVPFRRWPERALRSGGTAKAKWARKSWRHFLAAGDGSWMGSLFIAQEHHGIRVTTAPGDELFVHVVDHGLEAVGSLGPVRFATRQGELRLRYVGTLPETLRAAAVGRPVGALLDHAIFRGMPWIIESVEAVGLDGQWAFVVATGHAPFRCPWRQGTRTRP